MQPNPTVTLAALIAACKDAGMDVSDAERFMVSALAPTPPVDAAAYTRAAYNACIVAAMEKGYQIEYRGDVYKPDTPFMCDSGMGPACYGPTPADALYAALEAK